MVFENGVKNIQAAAYNGAHTVGNSTLQDLIKWTLGTVEKIGYEGAS